MKAVKLSLALFLIANLAHSQSDLILYNFNAVPQSLHVNPAMPQQTKLWVGIPVLSGYSLHYHNDGFKLIDLFERGTDINANFYNLLDRLSPENQIIISQSMDLLGIGFELGPHGFITFGATQNVDYRMDYPADLLRLIFEGNDRQSQYNLNTFDYELISRTNFYVGYQHKLLNDKLTVGGRLKYIIGQQHAYVDRFNAAVSTDPNLDSLSIVTDIRVRTSGPAELIDNSDDLDPFSLAFPGNSGFAVDLGANYKITKKLSASFSVLDIGSINWSDNNRDYVSSGEFHFKGIEADLSDDDIGNSYDNIVDSLEAAFDFKEQDGNSYSKALMSRIFLGVNYDFTPKHSVGLLYHSRIWNGEAFHDYSLNYVGRLSRAFQFTTSYSIINGTYNNIGAGFDVKMGPVQIYMMTENFLGVMFYENLQTTSFKFGINLTFYGKKEKPRIEEPTAVPFDDDNL